MFRDFILLKQKWKHFVAVRLWKHFLAVTAIFSFKLHNYPWNTTGEGDHHFTRQSYYGAPFLSDEGWYWYCVGLGGGFNREVWLNSWKPSHQVNQGHNLATLFVTARHAINSDD